MVEQRSVASVCCVALAVHVVHLLVVMVCEVGVLGEVLSVLLEVRIHLDSVIKLGDVLRLVILPSMGRYVLECRLVGGVVIHVVHFKLRSEVNNI